MGIERGLMQKEPEHQSSCNAAAKNAARLLLMHSLLGGGWAQHSGGPAGKTSRRSISMGLARSHLAIDGADVSTVTLGLCHVPAGFGTNTVSVLVPLMSTDEFEDMSDQDLGQGIVRGASRCTHPCRQRCQQCQGCSHGRLCSDCNKSTVQVQPSVGSSANVSGSHYEIIKA